jgi:hypothetical protein
VSPILYHGRPRHQGGRLGPAAGSGPQLRFPDGSRPRARASAPAHDRIRRLRRRRLGPCRRAAAGPPPLGRGRGEDDRPRHGARPRGAPERLRHPRGQGHDAHVPARRVPADRGRFCPDGGPVESHVVTPRPSPVGSSAFSAAPISSISPVPSGRRSSRPSPARTPSSSPTACSRPPPPGRGALRG